MAVILGIESATPLCSVALAMDGKIAAVFETSEEKSHASKLSDFFEKIFNDTSIRANDLDAVAIGKGPGSYTGLRIGVSTAKGLCYGAGIPLIAISTLKILFNEAVHVFIGKQSDNLSEKLLFCPMIDARRMEVFTCLFTIDGEKAEPVTAKIIDRDSFSPYLDSHRVVFFGTGMEKCREVLDHPHSVFLPGIVPHAASLAELAEQSYLSRNFEDLAYFEPFYLKDFIATLPGKNLLT